MARITFPDASQYMEALERVEKLADNDEFLERAVYKGAKVVADEIRKNLERLPSTPFRKLQGEGKFGFIPEGQKRDLISSFGLAPISRDSNHFVGTKAGFDGYGAFPTEQFPQGLPNALVARATESGSTVRQKQPFVRTAVVKKEKESIEAMSNVIDEELEKIIK